MSTLVQQTYRVTRNLLSRGAQLAQVSGVAYNQGELAYLDMAPVNGTDVTADYFAGYIQRQFSLASGEDFDARFPTIEAREAAMTHLFRAVFELGCITADRVAFSQVVAQNLPLAVLPAEMQLDSRFGILPPVGAGDSVLIWLDQSGNDHRAVNAVFNDALKYSVFGITPRIVYGPSAAGVAEERWNTVGAINVAGDWTLFALIDRNPDVSVQNEYYVAGFTAGATGLFVQGAATAQWGWTDGAVPMLAGEACPVGLQVLTIRKTGLNYDLRRNSVTKATAARLATQLSAFQINRRGDTPVALSGGHGYPEIIAYNSSLSVADMVLVENYLMSEWGVTP